MDLSWSFLPPCGRRRTKCFLARYKSKFSFDLPDERIILADGSTYHEKILFLGHQIPIITTAGIETDRGLAITGKNSISSWEQNGKEPISSHYEYGLKQGQWSHVVTVVDRNKNQLSTFLNGRMVNTSALAKNNYLN